MTTRHINDPARDTRKRIAKMQAAGLKPTEMAAALGISIQRVYQHLAALKEGAQR